MIFTKGLAKQLASKGIRIYAVAPGPVRTPLQVTGGQPTEKLPNFGKDTPMGCAGQPVELAPLYDVLASAESSYSTGQVFGALGGRRPLGGSPRRSRQARPSIASRRKAAGRARHRRSIREAARRNARGRARAASAPPSSAAETLLGLAAETAA